MNAPARHTTPVTDAERARIVALAAEGKTLSEISAAVGRDHSVVRRHLDAAGRQTTRRGYARVSCAEDRVARITSLSLAEPEPLAAHAADDDNDEDGDEGEGLVVAELALPPATPPAPAVSLVALDARPTLRSECRHASRPCPWVSCEEHALLAAVSGPLGSELTDDQLVELLTEMPYSCLADIVEERTLTLDEVAAVFGVTRERVRQLEDKGLTHLRFRAPRVGLTAEAVADILRPEPDELDANRARRESSHGGAVRFGETSARAPSPAPAHLAHLHGPAEVAAGRTFWCGRMGTPVDTSLCAGRHTAITRTHGGKGGNRPTHPECARCEDGAALLARLGADASKRPARRYLPLVLAPELPAPASAPVIELLAAPSNDHAEIATETPTMTTHDHTPEAAVAPAESTATPAPTPAEKPRCPRPGCKLLATRTGYCAPHTPRAPRVETAAETDEPTPPAPPRRGPTISTSVCAATDCGEIIGQVRVNTRPEVAHLCARHRKLVIDRVTRGPADLATVLKEFVPATAPARAAKRGPMKASVSVASAKVSIEIDDDDAAPKTSAPVVTAARAASTLRDALALAQRQARIVARLGGIEAAEALAARAEAEGGVPALLEALDAFAAELGGAS